MKRAEELPSEIEKFKTIDNISFDKTKQVWYYEDDHVELQFDESTKKWHEPKKRVALEEELNTQQLRNRKKQKLIEMREAQRQQRINVRKDTAVYVSNLPTDVTVEELEQEFSKFGILAEDEAGNKKVKIYKDSNNVPKGDALVVYYRLESVSMAIDMLDGTSLRPNKPAIKVQKARFTLSKANNKNIDQKTNKSNTNQDQKPAKVNRNLDSRIGDWDEDDALKKERQEKSLKRYEKTVILKHCFDLKEIEQDPEVVDDIEQDIQEECSKFGEVVKVTVFNLEKLGVVSVKFSDKNDALKCISQLDGRYFGGEKLQAAIHDGTVYKKSKLEDTTEEERLKNFQEFLDKQD